MIAIDLFAGFGGLTLGAELAGARVAWAANHWATAVDVHRANHPSTTHVCQDLRQADWSQLPQFDLLCAAPACQGHSRASQPRRRAYHDAMRSTAWAVVDCADVCRPRALVVENVLAFEAWPLFGTWRSALEVLGYRVQTHVVCATEHGIPQRRRRLFVTGVLGRRPVVVRASGGNEPTFAACIETSAGGWRRLDEAGPGARARMAAAWARHRRACLVQHTTGHAGIGLDEPIRTITTKQSWTLVDASGERYRWLIERELARAMGFPDTYAWPDDLSRTDVLRGLGNAVCPGVGRAVVAAVMEAA